MCGIGLHGFLCTDNNQHGGCCNNDYNWSEAVQCAGDVSVHQVGAMGFTIFGHLHAGGTTSTRPATRTTTRPLQGREGSSRTFQWGCKYLMTTVIE